MDLKGQLSNPAQAVRSLAGQGSRSLQDHGAVPEIGLPGPPTGSRSRPGKEKGRLSNPVQRRLTDREVDDLVTQYEAGSTIDTLAQEFKIHRTTVMAHLERRGVPGRSTRKLSHRMVIEAARRYAGGETLAEIAAAFRVAPSTLTRELRLAGTPIRPRGRRPPA